MSVRACGRRQSATHHRLASLEEVVATNTVFVTRKEGLRSNSTSTTSPTRSAARVDEEERNLGKEGLEDEEERDSHAPEGQLF